MRENPVPRIREIGSLQVQYRVTNIFLKKNLHYCITQ